MAVLANFITPPYHNSHLCNKRVPEQGIPVPDLITPTESSGSSLSAPATWLTTASTCHTSDFSSKHVSRDHLKRGTLSCGIGNRFREYYICWSHCSTHLITTERDEPFVSAIPQAPSRSMWESGNRPYKGALSNKYSERRISAHLQRVPKLSGVCKGALEATDCEIKNYVQKCMPDTTTRITDAGVPTI